MSSNHHDFSVSINKENLPILKKYCQENNLTTSAFINQLIDDFFASDIPVGGRALVQSYVQEITAPLTQRLDIIENQLKIKDDLPDKLAKESSKKAQIKAENRKYLPRHEVWQLLKKTSFVDYSGYDNFLKATVDEFENYGIFFDQEKKCYFIENKKPLL